MKRCQIAMLVVAPMIALLSVGVTPLASQEGGLDCLVCVDFQGPDGEGGWGWYHGFVLNSGSFCDQFPELESCRACGGTSHCHSTADAGHHNELSYGRCHQPCAPMFALLELSSEVSQLASSSDSRAIATLAAKIATEPQLEYDHSRNAVRLLDCPSGLVKQEWVLGHVAAPYFLIAVTELGPKAVDVEDHDQ